ncbi:MAG: divergent PAP2 family protein [Pelolinea sp.]|nr:divergent PAP2 family protein [Pelolinea sp.]
MLCSLIHNRVLLAAVLAWTIGQFLKAPLDYVLNKRWNWGIILSPGGMPSSHTALVTSVTLAIGFQEGFASPLFALSFAIGMIVVYDAAGVRRQAGIHAERINEMMKSFFENRGIPEKELKEVLGHTPFEVITGVILGILISLVLFWLFPFSPATSC